MKSQLEVEADLHGTDRTHHLEKAPVVAAGQQTGKRKAD